MQPDIRAQRRRLRRVQGLESEAYLNRMSQGSPPEAVSLQLGEKDVQIYGGSHARA